MFSYVVTAFKKNIVQSLNKQSFVPVLNIP